MWTVWCDNISQRKVDLDTFTDYGVKVGRSRNVRELRAHCQAAEKQILADDETPFIASIRVFTDNIEPHVQDAQNIHGGAVSASIPASHWTMCYFFNVLALLWAHDVSISRFINGIVLTRAVSMWHLSIWHRGDITEDARHELGNQLRLLTNCSECTFSMHNVRKNAPNNVSKKFAGACGTRGRRCQASHLLLDCTRANDSVSTRRLSAAIDYDKEMARIEKKYCRTKPGFARCDVWAVIGTILMTVVLTTFRLSLQSAA